MSSTTPTTLAELPALKGQVLGVSEWFEVTQDRVNTFADATDDHQWIHVDTERAAAESPFGGPIGHGFLTPSLFIPMWSQGLTGTARRSRGGCSSPSAGSSSARARTSRSACLSRCPACSARSRRRGRND